MALTEKMKDFCKEYINNGYNATQAYLTAYNGNSENAARIEGSKLLQRDEVSEYIQALLKPSYNKAISEREKKRQWLWDMINNPEVKDSDRISAMNILNKMDSEYINITQTIEDKETSIEQLDTTTLKALTAV